MTRNDSTLFRSGREIVTDGGAICFFVPEVQPALAAIVAELRELGLEAYSVVGVFDRAEDYWRAAHPPKPIFDIHARMMEVMPFRPPGEKPTPGPHPEMVRIVESIKRAIHPLPNPTPRRPPEPPAAPAAE